MKQDIIDILTNCTAKRNGKVLGYTMYSADTGKRQLLFSLKSGVLKITSNGFNVEFTGNDVDDIILKLEERISQINGSSSSAVSIDDIKAEIGI